MRKTSGISLMLLIFLSLCLITFSLLSLSGAVADEKLSQKAADHTTEYYQADREANEILSRIDAQLATYLKTAEKSRDPEKTYIELCAEISGEIPEASWTIQDGTDNMDLTELPLSGTISFTVPVNEKQELLAKLLIVYPQADEDTLYQIAAWKTINTGNWDADTSQNVLRLDTSAETENQ